MESSPFEWFKGNPSPQEKGKLKQLARSAKPADYSPEENFEQSSDTLGIDNYQPLGSGKNRHESKLAQEVTAKAELFEKLANELLDEARQNGIDISSLQHQLDISESQLEFSDSRFDPEVLKNFPDYQNLKQEVAQVKEKITALQKELANPQSEHAGIQYHQAAKELQEYASHLRKLAHMEWPSAN